MKQNRFAATIGFFDGVHVGHQALVRQLQDEASRRTQPTLIITFDRHPRQVLQPQWVPQLLSTLDEKRLLLASTGADRLEVLHFDAQLARLSARQFMADVLVQRLHVGLLLTGYDNHFGHQPPTGDSTPREGFADYAAYGRELGIDVVAGQPFTADGTTVSSSLVRQTLLQGDVALAARCLGRHYSLTGRVVRGEQVGRRLGFPTANIEPDAPQKVVPATGVYAVWAQVGDDATLRPAMMNIGRRPTFGGSHQTLEVHLADFTADLYGQTLTVSFVERLRDERPFASPAELAAQLAADRSAALNTLHSASQKP